MSNSQMTLTSRSGSLPTAFSSLSALGATVKHDRAAGMKCNLQEMQSFVYLFRLNSRLLTYVQCNCMWVNLYILHMCHGGNLCVLKSNCILYTVFKKG